MRRLVVTLLFICAVALSAAARPPTGPYEDFRVKTDNIPQAEIAGWFLPAASRAKGTVFILHGYNNNKHYMVGYEWIRDREGWNVLLPDFREHGDSTRTGHISTLGYYEIWDVKAVVDYADAKHLAKPYIILGRSLGAATGLRWASMDPRIDGVLAISPFKNAYRASQQLPASRLHIAGLPSPFTWSPGYRHMLEQVDIPQAVSKRDDLRIWIMSGEQDAFPPDDERAILKASPSPDSLKRLVVAPGMDHRSIGGFKGDAAHPSTDQYVREFLAATRRDRPQWAMPWVTGLGGAFGVAIIGLVVLRNRLQKTPPTLPQTLPEPNLPA